MQEEEARSKEHGAWGMREEENGRVGD